MSRPLSSVTNAIRLLREFSDGEAEIALTVLAKRLGLAKSTVHRLASTLIAEGLLEQNPASSRYRLGVALFGLGTLVRRQMDLSAVARPLLMELRQRTDETVLLAIPARNNVMHIYHLESTQAIRMRSDIGVERPAYCTAEGQAMLAHRPAKVVDQVIARGLAARTPRTITKPAALRARLTQVSRKGYALDDEESEAGMRSIAAPIRNAVGEVIAAVALAGPVQRLSREVIDRLIPLVVGTARAVSSRLGHRET